MFKNRRLQPGDILVFHWQKINLDVFFLLSGSIEIPDCLLRKVNSSGVNQPMSGALSVFMEQHLLRDFDLTIGLLHGDIYHVLCLIMAHLTPTSNYGEVLHSFINQLA